MVFFPGINKVFFFFSLSLCVSKKKSSFCIPDLQSLSGPELSETCQLLDNFLDNLNFPLLSTIRIGQGNIHIEIVPTNWDWYCLEMVELIFLLSSSSWRGHYQERIWSQGWLRLGQSHHGAYDISRRPWVPFWCSVWQRVQFLQSVFYPYVYQLIVWLLSFTVFSILNT